MISRDDIVWAIGYDGNAALVDRTARNRHKNMTTAQLAEAGLFRAAAASAIYAGSAEELKLVADTYNARAKTSYPVDIIARLFGVAKITVTRTLVL
jgi:hypothetical protein